MADPHDAFCEGCDVVLVGLANASSPGDIDAAVARLRALADAVSVREAWVVLMERSAARLRDPTAGRATASVVVQLFHDLLRRAVAAGDRVVGMCRSVARDLPPLLLQWGQRDAVLPMKHTHGGAGGGDSDEEDAAGGTSLYPPAHTDADDPDADSIVKTDPAIAADFARVYPTLVGIVETVVAAVVEHGAAAPKPNREAPGIANLILSVMAAGCSAQGCAVDDAAAGEGGGATATAADRQFALGPKCAADPRLAKLLASLPPYDDFNYLLLDDARRAHFEALAGGPADDDAFCGMPGFAPLHPQGLGLYLLDPRTHAHTAAPPPPFLDKWHVFRHSVGYLTAMLESTSTNMVWAGIEALRATLYRFPAYSLDLENIGGGGEAATPGGVDRRAVEEAQERKRKADLDVGGDVRGSEGMEAWFRVMQSVAHVMVGCPLHEVRLAGVQTLQIMFNRLQEATRFRVFTSFIRTCPHESVCALVVSGFKNEVRDEYEALVRAGTAEERDVLRRESAFLQHDVFVFATDLLTELAENNRDRTETIASLLALVQFILLRERVARVLALPADVLDRVAKAAGAVQAAVPAIEDASRGSRVQTAGMLAFTVSCVEDAVAALR